nr:hypothetical protein [Cellulomonas sp. APG4]
MLDDAQAPLDRPLSPTFTNRFDAEAWVGERWRELVRDGVRAVRLCHQGAPVAPVMPLRSRLAADDDAGQTTGS